MKQLSLSAKCPNNVNTCFIYAAVLERCCAFLCHLQLHIILLFLSVVYNIIQNACSLEANGVEH